MDFYYAKLNYLEKILFAFDDLKQDIKAARPEALQTAMKSGVTIATRTSQFMFTDVNLYEVEGDQYLYGKITKYADKQEKVADRELLSTALHLVPDKILSESHFVIEFKENFLLYTESKAHLNKNSFIEKFNNLIDKALVRSNFTCEAHQVSEQYSFMTRLLSMKVVESLDLTIFPTNPYPEKEIAEMDALLKRQNVKLKTIKYKGKAGGINVDEPEIRTNSIYVDVGYGKGTAVGEDKNGKRTTINSQRSDRQKSSPIDTSSLNPFDIVESISQLVNEKNK